MRGSINEVWKIKNVKFDKKKRVKREMAKGFYRNERDLGIGLGFYRNERVFIVLILPIKLTKKLAIKTVCSQLWL